MARQFFYDYNKPSVIPDGWQLLKTGESYDMWDKLTSSYELVPVNPPIPSARWDGDGWDVNTGRSGWKEALGEVMEVVIPGIITVATGGTVGAAVGGGMAGSIAGGAASGGTGAAMAGEDMGTGLLVGAAGGAIVGGIAGEGAAVGPDSDAGLLAENSFDTGAMAQAVGYTPPESSLLSVIKKAGDVAGQLGKESKTLAEVAGTLGALSGMESAGKVGDALANTNAGNIAAGESAALNLNKPSASQPAGDGALWAVGLGLAALLLN